MEPRGTLWNPVLGPRTNCPHEALDIAAVDGSGGAGVGAEAPSITKDRIKGEMDQIHPFPASK